MDRRRIYRIGRRALIIVLIAPLLIWLGVTIAAKLTIADDVPIAQLASIVGQGLFGELVCGAVGCEAELPEGIESSVFADSLVQDTTIALDIDEHGRVYVVETARQRAGGEDNRSHPYWLMDDLASRTIDDRRAYYEKALAEGRFEDPDHFTRNADRLVVLEDEDGDGAADRRTVMEEWNEIVSGLIAGVEAREGEIWVTAVPSLHRLVDADADGTPEVSEELHRGFGVKTSLGGHDLHGLTWGPDGKLYFSMGDRGYHIELPDGRILEPSLGPGRGAVFRMNADGSDLEVFATGVRNPQELAFDDHGNLFTGDNNGDGGDRARLVYLVEGGETGWAMPYQSLAGDYVRGPWVAERLWELQHPSQPAWILPPVAYIANGPSGLAHYPGLGLPSRYADHFFLCDYGYTNGRSGIWSFGVKPKGATFEIDDVHHFAWSILATDVDFDWSGQIFANVFNQVSLTQQVEIFRHPESRAHPEVEELRKLVTEGAMSEKSTSRLIELLGFPDQRLRLRAQFVLAERGEIDGLVRLARDHSVELIQRLHALWGLGQQGRVAIETLSPIGFDWAGSEDDEFRAQLMRVAGEARAEGLRAELEVALSDPAPRVRFFAAQSLGALGHRESVGPLFELIRSNADADVYIRHAAIHALERIGDSDAIWGRASDPSRSVRLAVLLVMRREGDPRIAKFLEDEDEWLVVEAARAIYDAPIEGAMPSLAALASRVQPADAEDLQVARALHRRVIGANVRLRSEEGAMALARYAIDETQLESLRAMALEALASYSTPPLRDLTMGFYRPLEEAPEEILVNVMRREGRSLAASSLGSRALEIASRIGEMPLGDEELVELALGPENAADARVSALGSLQARLDSPAARMAAEGAIDAQPPEVRSAARDLLFAVDREAGIEVLMSATSEGPSIGERQHAWRRLGEIDDPRIRARVEDALDAWSVGQLDRAVALEVLEAARRQPDAGLSGRAKTLLEPPGDSLVAGREWALEGGNAAAGRVVFQTHGDCQRCHGDAGGHGAGVGPSLSGVGQQGARFVLESILDPQARIAEGFASVVVRRRDGSVVAGHLVSADDTAVSIDTGAGASGSSDPTVIPRTSIDSISDPASGMPPIGLGLDPASLRDVVAYVMSLE